MPHLSVTGPDDKLAEVNFVLDQIIIIIADEYFFKWNDISGNSNAPGGNSSESLQAFIEINEGIIMTLMEL